MNSCRAGRHWSQVVPRNALDSYFKAQMALKYESIHKMRKYLRVQSKALTT